MSAPIAELLRSSDPAQVLQGLELVASMNDPQLESLLLGDSVFACLPVVCNASILNSVGHHLRCFNLVGPLNPGGFFTHIAALILLTRYVRRCPEAVEPRPGFRRIHLNVSASGWYLATRDLELASGEIVAQESSAGLESAEALLTWMLQAPDWQPGAITSRVVLLRVFCRATLKMLPKIYPNISSPIRELLCEALVQSTDRISLCLAGLPIEVVPVWVDLTRLCALDISGTGIRSLSGDLSGITLTLSAQQWTEWQGPLVVAGLSLEGIDAETNLRALPSLTRLSLTCLGPLPGDLFDQLPEVSELELIVALKQPLPSAVWLQNLRWLSLEGFSPISFQGEPPVGLERLTVGEDSIQDKTPDWDRILRTSHRCEVWLLSWRNIIRTIQVVRELTGVGLREAKHITESAPCLILRADTTRQAHEIRQQLLDIGAQVVLR